MTPCILHIPSGMLFEYAKRYGLEEKFLSLLVKRNSRTLNKEICALSDCPEVVSYSGLVECGACPVGRENPNHAVDVSEFEYVIVGEATE